VPGELFAPEKWCARAAAEGDPAHSGSYGVVTATPSNVEVFTVPFEA
jgi:hypothetical protein